MEYIRRQLTMLALLILLPNIPTSAQGNYNSEILKMTRTANLETLQDKLDSMNDPGVFGTGFFVRCRSTNTSELERLLNRTQFLSRSYEYIFNVLYQRRENPVKKYSTGKIGNILNKYGDLLPGNSTIRAFETEYCLARLKQMNDSELVEIYKAASVPSFTGRLIHREVELRKIRRASAQLGPTLSPVEKIGQVIRKALDKKWPRPELNQWDDITVGFRVDETGSISMVRILKSCGDLKLDQLATDAVQSLSPIQPLPKEPFKPFGIEFTFQGITNHRRTHPHD